MPKLSSPTSARATVDATAARIGNAFRAGLEARGLTPTIFAKSIGMGISNLDAILCGYNRADRSRRKIEAAFGQALWCTAVEFAERLPKIRFFGCDIEALTVPELVAKCRELGVMRVQSPNLPRSYYLDLLLLHYAGRRLPKPSVT